MCYNAYLLLLPAATIITRWEDMAQDRHSTARSQVAKHVARDSCYCFRKQLMHTPGSCIARVCISRL